MKKQIAKFMIMFGLCIGAGAANAYIEHDVAAIAIMDKAAGKVQGYLINVGETVKHEKLTLTVRTCKQTDPFDAEDFLAFVEISKNGEGKIFSNWMSRNEPGENPLQNADYDVWLVQCQ